MAQGPRLRRPLHGLTEPWRPSPNGPKKSASPPFLTNRYLDWLERQRPPVVRPSELSAASPSLRGRRPLGRCLRSRRGRPADLARHRIAIGSTKRPFGLPQAAAPTDEGALRRLRAQYYGMIGDVDAQLGRVCDALERLGQWEDTFVLLTSDHGEQLGDHGLMDKLGYFEESYRVPGIVACSQAPPSPRDRRQCLHRERRLLPDHLRGIGLEVPAQCDGLPLTAFP